jgi:DNA damage-binding protein 1
MYHVVLTFGFVLFVSAAVAAAGRTTSTTCMAYLDSGYVFLGSRGGDSQLIRLHETPLPPQQPPQADPAAAAPAPTAAAGAAAAADDPMGIAAAGGSSEAAAAAAAAGGDEGPNYVEVVDSWPSLAPILDFAVVDLERQGQGQVGGAACCRCVAGAAAVVWYVVWVP